MDGRMQDRSESKEGGGKPGGLACAEGLWRGSWHSELLTQTVGVAFFTCALRLLKKEKIAFVNKCFYLEMTSLDKLCHLSPGEASLSALGGFYCLGL